jgi:phage-related holin
MRGDVDMLLVDLTLCILDVRFDLVVRWIGAGLRLDFILLVLVRRVITLDVLAIATCGIEHICHIMLHLDNESTLMKRLSL